jgi:glycosyltransferase involved in cell wall biosynthesis
VKLVIVGHTYMVRANRGKLERMTELAPDVDITVVCPKSWLDALRPISAEESGTERIRVVSCPVTLSGRPSLCIYGRGLRNTVEDIRPDLVQVDHGPYSLAYSQVLRSMRRNRLRAKTVLFSWQNCDYRLDPLRRRIEQSNLGSTDQLVAGNAEALQLLRRRGYHGPGAVIPQLGVDVSKFQPKAKSSSVRNGMLCSPTIGYVGRLVREKGLLTLVSALGRLVDLDWKLVMVGDGPLLSRIREDSIRQGINDRIEIIRSVPHDEVPRYLAEFDVFVLPSESVPHWKEQFGHVLIEAMACNVPVVGSNSGEIPNVIAGAGHVFPAGDMTRLAETLRLLLTTPEARSSSAAKGLALVKDRYSDGVIAKRYLALYREVVNLG